jgi:hypothetical protein
VEGIMTVNAVTTSSSAAVQVPPAPPPKPAHKPAAEQAAAPPPLPPPAPAVNAQGQKIGTTINTTA